MADLCNAFLTAKDALVKAGELSPTTWHHLHGTCGRVVEGLGRTTIVEQMRPADFAALRKVLGDAKAPQTLGADISRTRQIFK